MKRAREEDEEEDPEPEAEAPAWLEYSLDTLTRLKQAPAPTPRADLGASVIPSTIVMPLSCELARGLVLKGFFTPQEVGEEANELVDDDDFYEDPEEAREAAKDEREWKKNLKAAIHYEGLHKRDPSLRVGANAHGLRDLVEHPAKRSRYIDDEAQGSSSAADSSDADSSAAGGQLFTQLVAWVVTLKNDPMIVTKFDEGFKKATAQAAEFGGNPLSVYAYLFVLARADDALWTQDVDPAEPDAPHRLLTSPLESLEKLRARCSVQVHLLKEGSVTSSPKRTLIYMPGRAVDAEEEEADAKAEVAMRKINAQDKVEEAKEAAREARKQARKKKKKRAGKKKGADGAAVSISSGSSSSSSASSVDDQNESEGHATPPPSPSTLLGDGEM